MGAIIYTGLIKPRKGLQMTTYRSAKGRQYDNVNITVKRHDKDYCDILKQEIYETHGFFVPYTELFTHIIEVYKANKPDWRTENPNPKNIELQKKIAQLKQELVQAKKAINKKSRKIKILIQKI